MRVFVTGATGWIGSAVVQELLGSGHQVLGLARSDAAARALSAAGAAVHRGSLDDLDSLCSGAADADGVIHTAFIHDWPRFMENIETDRKAVEAMARTLEGSGRPFLICSGTLMIAPQIGAGTHAPPDPDGPRAVGMIAAQTRPGVETDAPPDPDGLRAVGMIAAQTRPGVEMDAPPDPAGLRAAGMIAAQTRPGVETDAPPDPNGLRAAAEAIVVGARGVRGAVVRLPPTVHGAGEHGFISRLIAMAREHGSAAYIGEGANRWPAVHRLDAARVFVRGLERAAAGSRLHAVAEGGIPMRAIAETIGKGLRLPVRSVTQQEAGGVFDFLGAFVGIDNPASSAITQRSLGWTPREIDLLSDIEANYFA